MNSWDLSLHQDNFVTEDQKEFIYAKEKRKIRIPLGQLEKKGKYS